MPLRPQLVRLRQPNALHSFRLHTSPHQIPLCLRLQRRSITADEKPLPKADKPGPGPNQDQLPSVSEEAAATSKITGDNGPEIEQGTPVQEILKRDKSSQEKAPKIILEELNTTAPKGSRQFSTSARRVQENSRTIEDGQNNLLRPGENRDEPSYHELEHGQDNLLRPGENRDDTGPELEHSQNNLLKHGENRNEPSGHELKNSQTNLLEHGENSDEPLVLDELPSLPLPSHAVLKYRYDPIIKQFTNLMMRDGKLSKAQRNTALILRHLQTASPPRINPQRPLIPGAPPASHLPLNPVQYLMLAIDSVAPLLRIKSLKGAGGGGKALQVPVPLNQRQRRRQAVMWILDAAGKRRTRGSGHGGFAQKVAEELIAVAEGRSGCWDRRSGQHKVGVGARANLRIRK